VKSVLLAAWAVLALGGCAAENFSIRGLPDETPAADNATAIERSAAPSPALATAKAVPETQAASGTAGAGSPQEGNTPAAPPLTVADAPSMYTYDPWERLNRSTYRFNARFDEHLFLPAANGYRHLPRPVRAGVHNFFDNLSEVKTVANYVLQLRFNGGVHSLGRFVINSTVGIGGLFDVATRLHVRGAPTGFGVTLSRWGVHPGPYLVIPLLGPATLRDGVGYLGDFGINYGINLANLYRGNISWGLDVVSAVDARSNISFRYYATGSPFEYEVIRFLYVRKTLIEDAAQRGKRGVKEPPPTGPAGR
jgi:phospholipid-binding lipoprotein MlaA